MNESMNSNQSKNSNVLVSIFIDEVANLEKTEETLYSISKQSYAVDLLVLYPKNLEEKTSAILESLENPKIITRKQIDGKLEEEVLATDGKINYFLQGTENNK